MSINTGPTETGATDVLGAMKRLQSGLNPTEATANPEAQSEPALEQETSTADVNAETTKQAAEQETPQSDTEGPKRYDVKYGDETESLTVEELITNNMMERDYRFKTTELAHQRKAIEADRVKLDERMSSLEANAISEADYLASPEMQELKESDPTSYWQKFEAVKTNVDKVNAHNAEKSERATKEHQARLADENQKMLEAIPAWLDGAKLQSEWSELSAFLGGRGVDINGIQDHKTIVMARDLMIANRVTPESIQAKKERTPPKSTSPGTTVEDKKVVSDAAKERRANLSSSNSVEDAMAVFKDIFSSG